MRDHQREDTVEEQQDKERTKPKCVQLPRHQQYTMGHGAQADTVRHTITTVVTYNSILLHPVLASQSMLYYLSASYYTLYPSVFCSHCKSSFYSRF